MNTQTIFKHQYHTNEITKKNFLVTGGAGFIGSNLVEYLLLNGAKKVRVLDNLSNGFYHNIEKFLSNPSFEFIEGDITNTQTCALACEGIHLVSHQAALGSVPRSIQNPIATHDANSTGFLNMLIAARDAGVERFAYASSSSVYGDSTASPKQESQIGNPLSPYAVSKLSNELYASVFAMHYKMPVIGLRYFNVFGPRQDPNGPYAAAIPLFMNAQLFESDAVIYGDGEQTRDFTFVENAVQANVRALFTDDKGAFNKVYNIAVSESVSVNQLYALMAEITGSTKLPRYMPERKGDVKNSLADISMAKNFLGYKPQYKLEQGLPATIEWFKKTFSKTHA